MVVKWCTCQACNRTSPCIALSRRGPEPIGLTHLRTRLCRETPSVPTLPPLPIAAGCVLHTKPCDVRQTKPNKWQTHRLSFSAFDAYRDGEMLQSEMRQGGRSDWLAVEAQQWWWWFAPGFLLAVFVGFKRRIGPVCWILARLERALYMGVFVDLSQK